MPSKGKRDLSPEEKNLWETVAEGVDRLEKKKPFPEVPSAEPSESKNDPPKNPESPPKRQLATQPALNNSPTLPGLRSDRARNVDRRTWDRLRRGRLAIDGTLDLHGMRQEAAHRALITFIEKSSKGNKRCLLIVTGKGEREGVEKGWRGKGILKEAVPKWLNEAPLRGKIIAIRSAQPKDGGDGALYVLLKRQRSDS